MAKRTGRSAVQAAYERELQRMKTQLLRDLEQQSKQLLTQLQQQFAENLQAQLSESLVASYNGASASSAATSPLGTLSSTLGSVLRLKLNKPSIDTNSQETDRSVTAQSQFRVSRSQQAADISSNLSKGDSL